MKLQKNILLIIINQNCSKRANVEMFPDPVVLILWVIANSGQNNKILLIFKQKITEIAILPIKIVLLPIKIAIRYKI
jgi:hypothetical protein